MARGGGPGAGASAPPPGASTPPPAAQHDVSQFIATTLHEIQQEQGRIRGDISALSSKVDKVADDVGALKSDYTFFKGAAAALKYMWPAVAAIFVFGFTIVWWSLSDRIERLKQVTAPPPPPAVVAPTPPAQPLRR